MSIRRSAALLTMLAQVNYLIFPPRIALNHKLYLSSTHLLILLKAMEIALIDWIRKSKTNATLVEYRPFQILLGNFLATFRILSNFFVREQLQATFRKTSTFLVTFGLF